MKTYEVQLGRIADGAKDGNIDYNSPQIILVDAWHYPSVEEVESFFAEDIKRHGCDCVYRITPCEEWELIQYECYKNTPRYLMLDRK